MKYSEYGDNQGKLVVYFHGTPGAPEEALIFDEYAKNNKLRIICFDRFTVEASLQKKDYYQFLADAIKQQANGSKFDVVGFSIGAHVAIEVCILLDKEVRNLHLISSAAPLEAGEYIHKMAGKAVFNIAMKAPRVFSLLSYRQSFLSKVAPKALVKMLFASAVGEDKALLGNADFRSSITSILKNCFATNTSGYIRDIQSYVQPWDGSLSKSKVKTHLWHGVDDNWSPVEMAEYLRETLPNCANVELMKGLSHYSCLQKAAPNICQQLDD